MQKDLIYHYGKYFENDKVVLDSYSLDSGVYVKIAKNGDITKILEIDKKSYENLKGSKDYEWFKEKDFYSNMLDMNKSISTEVKEEKGYKTAKKLMSNNYLTLFFKNNIIKELCEQEKEALPLNIFKKVIQQYYNSLETFGNNEEKLMKTIEISELPNDVIIECKNIYLNNIEKIIQELINKNIKKGTRIKLFIEDSKENYEKSSLKYYALKIFNANTYNKFLGNELYGANNYNFSMNSKKPYYELKTTTYKVPSRITLKEIKTIRNMYIWLIKNVSLFKEQSISTEYTFDYDLKNEKDSEKFFLLKCINDNGNLVIDNFEYIPKYTSEMKDIIFKNRINSIKLKDFEQKITNSKDLEVFLSKNWFVNCLQSGYHDYKSVTSLRIDSYYKNFIIQYSRYFYEFFYKLNDKPLKQNIDKIGITMTKEILLNEITSTECMKFKRINSPIKSEESDDIQDEKTKFLTLYNSTKSLNIYLTLKEYLNEKGGENVEHKIDRLKENMRNVMYKGEHIKTDEDFYFIVGQVSYYLNSHSKASRLTLDIIEPILNAGKIEVIKKELNFLRKRYGHEIRIRNNIRFRTTFPEILAYEPKEDIKSNEDVLLIGFLTDNLFFEKKER